jgi:hypothetical protein
VENIVLKRIQTCGLLPRGQKMSQDQLKFDFQKLQVGDLVIQNEKYSTKYKTYGVIVDIDLDSFEVIQVHWLNYGTFWTACNKVIKVNKNEKV